MVGLKLNIERYRTETEIEKRIDEIEEDIKNMPTVSDIFNGHAETKSSTSIKNG